MDEATRNRLTDIQARYAHDLMEKPNVVGVGIAAQSRAAAQSQVAAASGSAPLCRWLRSWRPAETNRGPRVTG